MGGCRRGTVAANDFIRRRDAHLYAFPIAIFHMRTDACKISARSPRACAVLSGWGFRVIRCRIIYVGAEYDMKLRMFIRSNILLGVICYTNSLRIAGELT